MIATYRKAKLWLTKSGNNLFVILIYRLLLIAIICLRSVLKLNFGGLGRGTGSDSDVQKREVVVDEVEQ